MVLLSPKYRNKMHDRGARWGEAEDAQHCFGSYLALQKLSVVYLTTVSYVW